jgi:glycosyltransferase involved in cell wall biosynthesis
MKSMNKLKIVQIIPELNLKTMGGIGRFLQNLLLSIDKEKTENLIITYKSDFKDREYYENFGISVFSLLENTNLPDKTAIETTQWLIKTLKKIQPDVVNTHSFWGTTLGVKSAYKAGVPVIVTTDDNIDLDETPQQKRVKKQLAEITDCIICVSNAVKNYAHQIEKISEDKLRVIYNGMRFNDSPSPPAPLPKGSLEFVFIARLEPQKVPLRVINAIAKLQHKRYDSHLFIIGDGSLKTECEQQVKQLKLTNKIKFLGYQENPWQSVNSGSIFVMTSDFEGFGLTVIEAMSSGYLCVLPTLEPLLEIATNGEEAIFYESGNQEDLETKMELALTLSPEQKSTIIHQARTRVEQNFSAKVMAQNYLNLYQELFYRKLGDNLSKKNQLNQAISAYRKALNISPNSGWCYQNIAEIVAQKGWRNEAVNFYAQAWLSNPQEVKKWHDNYKSIHSINSTINPIFVVGCFHSGTTLMLRILSNYSLFYGINYESKIFTKSSLEIATKLKEWELICGEQNKQRWVEKAPDHIYTLGKIFAHCPQSKIIWMLRDGRDVVCSKLQTRNKIFGFEKLLNNWIASNIAGLNFIDDPRIKLVKYEDLVTNTEQTLQDIFQFLEADYVETILDYQSKSFYFMNNQNLNKPKNNNDKKYISQLRNWQINQPIFDGRNLWQTEMTQEQKEIFKQKAQEYLVQFGYVSDDNW